MKVCTLQWQTSILLGPQYIGVCVVSTLKAHTYLRLRLFFLFNMPCAHFVYRTVSEHVPYSPEREVGELEQRKKDEVDNCF